MKSLLSATTAKSKQRAYQDYVKAGFTAEQAFSLALASVKPVNFTEMLGKAKGLSVSNGKDKGREASE